MAGVTPCSSVEPVSEPPAGPLRQPCRSFLARGKVGPKRLVYGPRLGTVQMAGRGGSGGDTLSWLRPCSPDVLFWGVWARIPEDRG